MMQEGRLDCPFNSNSPGITCPRVVKISRLGVFAMNKGPTATLAPELLLIGDDVEIRKCLRDAFSAEHYRVREAKTAKAGINQFKILQPDAVILDLDLAATDGIDVIYEVRSRNRHVPMIVLSVRKHEQDKIMVLDAGADDFVNKPFSVGELLARVRATLRRPTAAPAESLVSAYRTGQIDVDFSRRRVLLAGKHIHLTRIEFKLLRVLIRHADHVVTHSQLLTEVWGPDEKRLEYLRVYMLHLRRKLEADPANPRYLQTEPGIGYRLITEHFPWLALCT